MAGLKRTIAVLLDTAIVVALLVLVFVLSTDGGAFAVGGVRVSVRSPDTALVALPILVLLRAATLGWADFLGLWPTARLEGHSTALCDRFSRWSTSVSPVVATRIVLGAALATLLVKAGIAVADPGFFSGDDVEIHEMTLGHLLRQPWPVWNLRSPVFPFGFILPGQWLAKQAGASDIGTLIIAGRLSVAILSTAAVWLVWKIAAAEHRGASGYAVLAALFVATAKLHVAYGTTELPRPVATVVVLLAYLLLASPTTPRMVAAGAVLGGGASLRFSEAAFVLPAMTQLAIQRRYSGAATVAVVSVLIFSLLVAIGDYFYWGQPFYSLRAAADYTLVDQLSSRGYQAPWWYVSSLFRWTTVPLAALAVLGMARHGTLTLWLALPLIGLSALPHKEARYAIPLVPFVCLLASHGVRRIVNALAAGTLRPAAAPVLLAGVLASLAMDINEWRLARSNADIPVAIALRSACREDAAIAVEQLWRIGGRLYLGSRPASDLDPSQIENQEYLEPYLSASACIAVDRRTLDRHPEVGQLIETQRFVPLALPPNTRYVAWRR